MDYHLSDLMSEDEAETVLRRMWRIQLGEVQALLASAAEQPGEWIGEVHLQVRVYVGHSSRTMFRIRREI